MEKSCFPVFLFVYTLLGSAFIGNSQTTDSCYNNLSIGGLPFDTASLQCTSAWDSDNFILRYGQTSTDLWSFVLSTPDSNAYVAIGFSSNGRMVGSSAIVGWVSATDGTGVIKQYYLGGQTPSQVVVDQGSLNVSSSMIISKSSRLYLAFQLTTARPSSNLIYAIGPTGSLPVAKSYTLTQHQDETSTSVNYVTGQSSGGSRPYTRLRRGHGILNILGWGMLLIIGAMVARYLKNWDPTWFYVHAAIQSLGFTLGLIGVISGFALEDRLGADVSTHKALGIFILVLGSLQMMALLARPDKVSKVRKYWNWYHHGVGRILIIFAIANVFYGIQLGETGHGWQGGYGVIIAILFVSAVILEVRMLRMKK